MLNTETSEQKASDSEDCQTLMEKITQDGNKSDSESKDEILAEIQKEYEDEDSIGKNIQNPQLAKLLGKMFRSRLLDKVLNHKLECQDRLENCKTAKPTRVKPYISLKLREPLEDLKGVPQVLEIILAVGALFLTTNVQTTLKVRPTDLGGTKSLTRTHQTTSVNHRSPGICV